MRALANKALAATLLLAAGLTQVQYSSAADVSGMLKSTSAYGFRDHELQQQEWLLALEVNGEFLGGDITAITRLRFDTLDRLNPSSTNKPGNSSDINFIRSGRHGSIELREAYWEKSSDVVFWRIGKQQVVWGEADGLRLLDLINPQSFREFILDDFDDARIPLWMLNAEVSLSDNGVLQLLWIPDTSTHELAPSGSPYEFSSPRFVPSAANNNMTIRVNPAEAPGSPIKDSDLGFRYTDFRSGWDFSLNYLYHYIDSPRIRSSFIGGAVIIDQDFTRSHLMGGSVSTSMGDWILRAELAFETDRYYRDKETLTDPRRANQWSTVIGLDWQGWSDQFVSMQWFQTRLNTNTSELVQDKHESTLSLLWQVKFLNETLDLEWLQLHNMRDGDGLVQGKISYNLEENIDIYLGLDVFYGDKAHLFGQFDDRDRISLGFEWGL